MSDVVVVPAGTPDGASERPWLDRRDGESDDQFIYRMARTCPKCGGFFVIPLARAAHQEQCTGSPDVRVWRDD